MDGFEFGFDESACEGCGGQCCIGESGYVWVNPAEIKALCERVELGWDEFVARYLSKVGYRYTLKEMEFLEGYRCIFFDVNKRLCSVYEDRPTQCRSFPFWEHFKNSISEVKEECLGIYKL